jgi:hypothetical protein
MYALIMFLTGSRLTGPDIAISILLVWIAVLTSRAAACKGYNKVGWLLYALFVPIIAIVHFEILRVRSANRTAGR